MSENYCIACGEEYIEYRIRRRPMFSENPIPFNYGRTEYENCKVCGTELLSDGMEVNGEYE